MHHSCTHTYIRTYIWFPGPYWQLIFCYLQNDTCMYVKHRYYIQKYPCKLQPCYNIVTQHCHNIVFETVTTLSQPCDKGMSMTIIQHAVLVITYVEVSLMIYTYTYIRIIE